MILEIALLVIIILNLAAMSICAFMKKTNLLLVLGISEAVLAVGFALLVT